MWNKTAVGLLLLSVSGALANDRDRSPMLHAKWFAEDPYLVAQSGQSVLLDTLAAEESEPALRYSLQAGKHRFCLEGNQPYFTGMALEDEAGQEILRQEGNPKCFETGLSGGNYTLHVLHSSSPGPDAGRVALVSTDAPSPTVVDSAGNALAGFWAIQLDPNLDPSHRDGILRVLPPFVTDPQRQLSSLAFMPMVGDFQSTEVNGYSMFQLRYTDTDRNPLAFSPAGSTLNMLLSNDANGYMVVEDDGSCAETNTDCVLSEDSLGLHVRDLGNYEFKLSIGGYPPANFVNTSFSPLTLMNKVGLDTGSFRLVFRYFADGNVGALQEGEVALFEKPNYQGRAIVIGSSLPNIPEWTTILEHPGSIRFGNNTAANLFASPGFDGSYLQEYQDAATAAYPAYASLSAIQIQTLTSMLGLIRYMNPPDCSNCQLNGSDLTSVNLNGIDFQNAHFAGANLTNATFNNSVLTGADFSGATLSCTNFSGTDINHLHDLTQTNFSNVQLVAQSGCRTSFAYTHISGDWLTPALLSSLDLTGAVIENLSNHAFSSQAQPLDLTGAVLTNASLAGVILDYAKGFSGASVTGIHLDNASLQSANLQEAVLDGASMRSATMSQALMNSASLRHVNFTGAKLYGAVLDNANLESATLQSAYLTNDLPSVQQAASLASAFLRNANLSFAQMSGANLTNASFYGFNGVNKGTCAVNGSTGETAGCATAHQAVMNNTVLAGAYLFGVDFTNAQATGAVFSNAVLVAANFDQAVLGSDSTASTTTSFDSAFLQGTNFGTASLDHVSLAGAYVDFSNGNTLDIKLPGSHTRFPGYWGQPGQAVCAEPSYSGPTVVPATNSTIACPDGNKYPSGCGGASPNPASPWNNNTDISSASTPASYENNATYTPAAATPICADDVNWDVGGGNQ